MNTSNDPKGFYNALGVEVGALHEQIKQAYKREAKVCHPDKNPLDQSAEQRFKFLSHAYQVLSNTDTRALYDSTGSEYLMTCPVKPKAAGIFGRRKSPPQCRPREFKDPFSVFQSVFSDIGDFDSHTYNFTPVSCTTATPNSATDACSSPSPSSNPFANLSTIFCMTQPTCSAPRSSSSSVFQKPLPPRHSNSSSNTRPMETFPSPKQTGVRQYSNSSSKPATPQLAADLLSSSASSSSQTSMPSPSSTSSSISSPPEIINRTPQRPCPLSAIACATVNFLQSPGHSTCRVRRLFERKMNCVQSSTIAVTNPLPAGIQVVLTSLPNQCAKYNGTEATILHYDRLTGRYSLCVKGKTFQLPPNNIYPKEAEVCVANLADSVMNGKRGKVTGYDPASDKYHVLMMCGTMLYLSPQNLDLPPHTLVQVVVDSIGGGLGGVGTEGDATMESTWALIDGLEDSERYRVRLVDGRLRVVPRDQARLLVATQPQQSPQQQLQQQAQALTIHDQPMQDQ